MTEQELQLIFEQPFEWKNWRKVMDFVFPEFAFSAQKTPIDQFTKAAEERVEGFFHHGSTQLQDNFLLNLYEVELKGSVDLPRNVKGIRKFIASEAIANTQASIAVFYSPDKSKWRFTLAIKHLDEDYKEKDRKPESYTYVFGKGEKGRTAAIRFSDLAKEKNKTLKNLEDAFSVEALSKKFFTQYKNIYLRFVDNIINNPSRFNLFKATSKEIQEKLARDFVKKMMGRIVFLYFLQKKGWIGCKTKWSEGKDQFMQELFNSAPRDNSFYMNYLIPLFFKILNKKRQESEEECFIQGKPYGKVPFLNGGLFEREEGHPDNLTIDWEIFKRFFEVLDSYNFTIIEDDPDYKEVAVDPEMLGHIFENLLEDNKDKGAFYTPKEIVQYMCRESLIEYLYTKLSEKISSDNLKDAIRKFVEEQAFAQLNNLNQNADRYLLKALRDVKVCDPAIGSGAFPMGILLEIFRMVEHFEYSDVFRSTWEMDEWDAALVKEQIIQNSIYGVDIEKGAVDIARLRFWLSIIIDEEEPKPLPNLDYKIMQGNSLLERFGPIDLKFDKTKYSKPVVKQENLFGEVENPQISIAEAMAAKGFDISELEQKFFNTEDPEEKESLRRKITEFEKAFLKDQIKAKKNKVISDINTLSKKLRDGNYAKLNEKKKDEKLLKLAEADLIKITDVETESKLIKEGNKPYFLWSLYFMDVMDRGGFDVVIGNPPYIQLQRMGVMSDILNEAGFKTFARTGDIYCLFYELGIEKLKQGGILSYITSNSWQQASYGKPLREYFASNNPLSLINFEDAQLFETAIVETNILNIQKASFHRNLNALRLDKPLSHGVTLNEAMIHSSVILCDLPLDGWSVSDQVTLDIKQKMEKIGKKLEEWDIVINYGVKTGYNEAFVIDGATKDELIAADPKNADLIKPTLRGRDLKRYTYEFADKWLIFTHNGLKADAENYPRIDVPVYYPSLYEYFKKHLPKIKERDDQGDHWTNLRNCKFIEDFEKPKIIWGELSNEAKFTFDDSGHYVEATLFMLVGEKLKYLLGILNSKVAQWYFEKISTTSGMGTNRWKKYKIINLPAPEPSESQEEAIEILVNAVLDGKKAGKDTKELEDKIDVMVFKLYQLTYQEVLVIAPNFWVSEEEYNNISLEQMV